MVNDEALDLRFLALAHPVRRGIVERLAAGPATVGEAAAGAGVSKPAISRHLRVLEEARVIARAVEGRTHRLSLRSAALGEAAAWIERQRGLWDERLDAMERYLAEQAGERGR